jgi:hypothetical protein
VPVVARANGVATVNLTIITPEGQQRIVDTVALKAKVTTLTGLAQVLTGGALLVLATWWLRNMRRSRRTRDARAAQGHHPVNGKRRALAHFPAAAPTQGEHDTVE